jgi:hypothetical protein
MRVIAILVFLSLGLTACSESPLAYWEAKYGKLTQFEPKATFVHYKDSTGIYQYDFIKTDKGLQYLTKSKIKE